uniref:Pectinesterase inhibitor domain-containing protein n=1 Tax=Ananas comosus var. bracteatus TaxID=296719 RepID=A0A6V7P4S4_ANACO|nr:unnamed protein product [Ananas comosus var. bracteatus]
MSNVRTWCSAALTDETTCLDGVTQAGSRQARPAARAARCSSSPRSQATLSPSSTASPRNRNCYAAAVCRSPQELARFALAVSADRARSAVARLAAAPPRSGSGSGPVHDCLENMADSVDRPRDAAAELARTGSAATPPGPSSDTTVLHALRVRPRAAKRIRKYKYAKA